MWTVAEANLVPILVAMLIGIVTGWWLFKRIRPDRRSISNLEEGASLSAPAQPRPSERRLIRDGVDTREGNSLTGQAAAATSDVAGDLPGAAAFSKLPGAEGPPDDLQTLKGVGAKLAAQLGANGITRFDQLARLSADEAAILDDQLGPFRGRVARDRLVEQAAYLARGDTDGFEAKFGKLGGGAPS